MAPKHRRQAASNKQPDEGTAMERAILCSLGEMTGMLKNWVSGQAQNQNANQSTEPATEREIEQK